MSRREQKGAYLAVRRGDGLEGPRAAVFAAVLQHRPTLRHVSHLKVRKGDGGGVDMYAIAGWCQSTRGD